MLINILKRLNQIVDLAFFLLKVLKKNLPNSKYLAGASAYFFFSIKKNHILFKD
jgi:hypothetical protein